MLPSGQLNVVQIFNTFLTSISTAAPLFPVFPLVVFYIFSSQHQREQLVSRQSFDSRYDYIIVGAGSGGSVMARRLSDDPNVRVLLIEAGGEEKTISQIPLMAFFLQRTPLDWSFITESQSGACTGLMNNQSIWPRGKVMGGCSGINAMLYVRGNRRDYDKWAHEDGAEGWSWQDVFPYFLKTENNTNITRVNNGYHGTRGMLAVSDFLRPTKISEAFVEAGPHLGYPADDFNGPIQSTFALPQRTIKNGERLSISKAYLEPIRDRDNLHILAKTYATRILFDDKKRAIGVQFDRNDRKNCVAYARKEVIVSAGAIMSPHLLLMSGVGPKKHLEEIGIPVVADLPVGLNLQEHFASGMMFTVEQPISLILKRELAMEQGFLKFYEYFVEKKNVLTSNILEGIAFVKTKFEDPKDDWPDIEMHMIPGSLTSDNGAWYQYIQGIRPELFEAVWKPNMKKDTFTIYPTIMRPKSRGWVKLRSTNPYDRPRIQPNYFEDPYDLDVLVEGMKIALAIAKTPPMQAIGAKPFQQKFPGCESLPMFSDDYLRCVAKVYTTTIWHPTGTCKMGAKDDPTAVVDKWLRVRGVKGLRVVDASVMPTIITGNLNAPTVMIAERAADFIKGRRLRPLTPPVSEEVIKKMPDLDYEPL